MSDGMLISPDYDRQIRDSLRRDRRTQRISTEMQPTSPRRLSRAMIPLGVVLDETLPVATQSKTGASSALARICNWKVADEDYVETQQQVRVWNHSESKAYAVNTFGIVIPVQGHLVFFGDCDVMATPSRTELEA